MSRQDSTPSRLHQTELSFTLADVDSRGCLGLMDLASALGWVPGQALGLTVDGDLLRLSDLDGAFDEAAGDVVELDERHRLRLPYGVRLATGLMAGAIVVLTPTIDQGLLVVPLARLAATR